MLLIFVLVILLFILTLLIVYVVNLPEEQQERFRSNRFLRLFLSAAKDTRETEVTPRSPLADHPDTAPEQAGEPIYAEVWSIRQVLGVALTAALMLAVPLVVGLDLASIYLPLGLFFSISAAAAGAIGFRTAKLSWRQTVLAAVLAGACFVITVFLGLFGGLWVIGGVFLLPLFDPAIRQVVPAPSTGKVAATALALSAPYLLNLATSSSGRPSGIWGVLFVGPFILIPFILSSILLVVGLTVALFAPRAAAGSWIGGVGILLGCMHVGVVLLSQS
jgi:hypothetical protein